MKKLLLSIIAFAFGYLGFAQTNTDWGMPYNTEKKVFMYEEVVPVDGVSKADLYKRANTWISTYFTNGQNKIYERDPEQNSLKMKHKVQLYKTVKKEKVFDCNIEFHIDMAFKDGKFKYTIYKFRIFADANSQPIEKWMDANYTSKEADISKYTNLNAQMQEIIDSMKKALLSGGKDANSNW